MPLHSFIYSLPYICVAFFLLFLYRYENQYHTKKVIVQLLFLFMLFFLGLRGHLFTDFISYYSLFQEIPTIDHLFDIINEDSMYEKGFVLYISLFKSAIPNYYIWIFFNTLLDLLVITWLFKKYSKSVLLSFIFFFAFNGLTMEANLFRNMKAICFFILSIPYIQQKRFLPYLILNIIGTTFHSSSFFYIPFYFVLNRTFSKSILIPAFIVVNVLFFLQIDIVSSIIEYVFFQIGGIGGWNKLYSYQVNSTEFYGFSIGYIERTIGFILFLINYKKLTEDASANKIFCNSFFLYYLLFYFFYNVSVLAERIPLLLIYSYWLLYPNLLSLVTRNKIRIYALAFCFCLLKIATSYSSVICKYDNWLLGGIKSYEERRDIYQNNPELW